MAKYGPLNCWGKLGPYRGPPILAAGSLAARWGDLPPPPQPGPHWSLKDSGLGRTWLHLGSPTCLCETLLRVMLAKSWLYPGCGEINATKGWPPSLSLWSTAARWGGPLHHSIGSHTYQREAKRRVGVNCAIRVLALIPAA